MTAERTRGAGGPGLLRGELAIGAVVLIWGANFAVIKAAVNEIPPFAFAAVRFGIATPLILLIVRLREGSLRWPRGAGRHLLWLGLLGHTVYQVLFMTGISRTSAGNTALLIAPTPVLIALFGAATGVERATRAIALGAVATFLGVALVASAHANGPSAATIVGDLLVLGASVCWASYTVGVRAVNLPVSALQLTAFTMLTGAPGLVLIGAGSAWSFDWGSVTPAAWLATVYATLLGLVTAYILWNYAVQTIGGTRTGVIASLIPVVGLLLAAILLAERPTAVQIVGAGLIVGGVAVARRGGGKARAAGARR